MNHATISQNRVVIRLGELFLKGGNRGFFLSRLRKNLQWAIRDLPWQIKPIHSRFLAIADNPVVPPHETEEVLRRLQKVFGISSLGPAVSAEPDPDELERITLALLAQNGIPHGTATFRIDAHRSDKRLPFNGGQLNERIGAAVVEQTGLKVNLDNPDLRIIIEAGKDRDHTFISTETRPGPGGLPTGASGRAMLMLSCGIDSPAAAYLAMKRGLYLDGIYFHSFPYTGDAARDKVIRLGKILSEYGGIGRVHVVPFTQFQLAVRDNCPADLAVLLYRRMMVRISCAIAEANGAEALVTGESLGQVASQTLTNLTCIEDAADRPILRPLITADKQETITLARKIGTYETSILPHQDCCSLFVPKHPVTKGNLKVLSAMEARLDLEGLLKAAIEGVQVIPLID